MSDSQRSPNERASEREGKTERGIMGNEPDPDLVDHAQLPYTSNPSNHLNRDFDLP